MKPEQKQLVKESWRLVQPIREPAAELFYTRLFETCPEVRPYFHGDMKVQGLKLMAMLDAAVNAIDDLESLIEPLHRSGKAHKGYGVGTEDYAKVRGALLWALERGLGDAFSEDIREAWTVTYDSVAQMMIEGAG